MSSGYTNIQFPSNFHSQYFLSIEMLEGAQSSRIPVLLIPNASLKISQIPLSFDTLLEELTHKKSCFMHSYTS